jgi:predicted MFS family arabinose efflux permease
MPHTENRSQSSGPLTQESTGKISHHNRSIWLIGASTFFYWAALYLYVPILPVYAKNLGASLTAVGIIVASYAVPQLLFRIPIGLWSDHMGRQKPLVIAGMFIVILSSIGLYFSPDPFILGVARAGAGLGAAVWAVITVYLVSFFPPDKTQRAIAILNLVNSGSLVVATMGGGLISDHWGKPETFTISAVLGAIALGIVIFARENRLPRTTSISLSGLVRVAGQPLLLLVSVMGVLLFFAQQTGIFGFVPIYAAQIGASDTELGILTMLAMGLSMAGALAVAPLVKHWGHSLTIAVASGLLGLALLAIPFVHSVFILDWVQSLNGLGKGILTTELMSLSVSSVSPQQRATAMGFYQAVYSIGMLIGPLISGALADHYGLNYAFYMASALCLIVVGMAYLPVLSKRTRAAA